MPTNTVGARTRQRAGSSASPTSVGNVRAGFDSWESYFYPDTYDSAIRSGTLRNLYGERDALVLARLEYVDVAERMREVLAGEVDISRTFDSAHLRAIHRYLFQDVYEWAGEYRTVDISKGPGRDFGRISGNEIDQYISDVNQMIVSADWRLLSRAAFVQATATVFAYVNQGHPFREGNGRTSKVFMDHVSDRSRFAFDYARVTPEVWNNASALSAPDLHSYEPVAVSLLPVFDAVTIRRGGG